jgi:hypothetical protein
LRLTLEEKESLHISITEEIHGEHNAGKEELHTANQEMLAYHASEMTKMKLEHANAHSELLNSHSTLVNSLNLKHQENTARLQMEHQTALNGFNDQLSAKEKYHLSLIESM